MGETDKLVKYFRFWKILWACLIWTVMGYMEPECLISESPLREAWYHNFCCSVHRGNILVTLKAELYWFLACLECDTLKLLKILLIFILRLKTELPYFFLVNCISTKVLTASEFLIPQSKWSLTLLILLSACLQLIVCPGGDPPGNLWIGSHECLSFSFSCVVVCISTCIRGALINSSLSKVFADQHGPWASSCLPLTPLYVKHNTYRFVSMYVWTEKQF